MIQVELFFHKYFEGRKPLKRESGRYLVFIYIVLVQPGYASHIQDSFQLLINPNSMSLELPPIAMHPVLPRGSSLDQIYFILKRNKPSREYFISFSKLEKLKWLYSFEYFEIHKLKFNINRDGQYTRWKLFGTFLRND